MAKAYVRIDDAAMAHLLTSPTGEVSKDLFRRGKNVEALAKIKCPVDTGRLRSSITTQLGYATQRGVPIVRVGTNVKYALWVHNGTGMFGPRMAMIKPRKGQYLVFTIGGKKIFARQVIGQKGKPFLRDALPAALR